MQRVRVAGAGHAVAQQAAVIGEAAIGLDDGRDRARRGEHALHRKLDAVERGAPQHLAHERQHDRLAARVSQPQRLDACVISERMRAQFAETGDLALLVAEHLASQRENRFVHRPLPPRRRARLPLRFATTISRRRAGRKMASVEIVNVRKAYGPVEVIHGVSVDMSGWRVRHAGRAVRLRQVDAAAHDRGAGGDHDGEIRHRRPRGQRPRAARARHRHGVPELCALSAHDGGAEHELRAQAARRAARPRSRRASSAPPRSSTSTQLLGRYPAPVVGRPASARRDGPRHRARSAGVPVRRAALQSRRQAARADARRDQGAAPAAEDHDDLRHARSGRGDDHGRPHRRDARRRDRADGPAAGALRPARRPCSSPASSARRR